MTEPTQSEPLRRPSQTALATRRASGAPRLTPGDLEELLRLVTEVCEESGHGQVTIRVRDGLPAYFEKVVTVVPPSRRAPALAIDAGGVIE